MPPYRREGVAAAGARVGVAGAGSWAGWKSGLLGAGGVAVGWAGPGRAGAGVLVGLRTGVPTAGAAAVGMGPGVTDARGVGVESAPRVASFRTTCEGPAGRPPVPTRVTFREGRYVLDSRRVRTSLPRVTVRTTAILNPSCAPSTASRWPSGRVGSSSTIWSLLASTTSVRSPGVTFTTQSGLFPYRPKTTLDPSTHDWISK